MAPHSSITAWRIPWTEEPGSYRPWCHKETDTTEVTEHTRLTNRVLGNNEVQPPRLGHLRR